MKTLKAVRTTTRLASAALLFLAGGAAYADSTVQLTAAASTTTLPDGQTVPMWGYVCGTTAPTPAASCTAANGTPQSASTWQPPLITVPAGKLTITLKNTLSFTAGAGANAIPTSLVIVGQLGGGLGDVAQRTTMPSPTHAPQGTTWPGTLGGTNAAAGDAVFTPPPQSNRVRSFATEVKTDAPGTLTWNDLRPGTYLIESGTEPSIQAAMGLYGVLVVTDPAGVYPYKTLPSGSQKAFDASVALLLSEIDPVQNRAVDTAVHTVGFDETKVWNGQAGECGDPTSAQANTCYPPVVNYSPLYYLVNGVAFDRTNMNASGLKVPADATQGRVLLSFVNAGSRMHVPSVVGANMTLLAEDGNVLPGVPKVQSELFLAAGKTYDVAIQPPLTAAGSATYAPSTYAIYDRALNLSTGNQRDGGMQAYVLVAGGTVPSAAAVAVTAADKTYYCSAGATLDVRDAGAGLLAGATGASGVVLGTAAGNVANGTLTLRSNGTFTYVPPAAGCAGSFTYLINGTAVHTATIVQCDASNFADPTCKLAGAPVASDVQFVSRVASRYVSPPPGVLGAVTNPTGGLALTAQVVGGAPAGLAFNADGSFSIAGPGAACPANLSPAAPANAKCLQFQYQAKNTQGTTSNTAIATVIFEPASGLNVKVYDAPSLQPGATPAEITDYRWIIEEDRTFWVDPKCQVNVSPRPTGCAPLPVESLGYNFHTAHMPVVAQGCTGAISCEQGQTVGGVAAVCDVGNGTCRTDADQQVPTFPADVHLDPNKRYFISILPGDGVNATIGGAGGPDDQGRPFDIVTACGKYTGPTGAWEPAGAAALCGHAMGGSQIAPGQADVRIALQETPLPTAQIAVFVFQDDNPLNGENDAGGGVDTIAPNEPGLGGFEVKLFDQAGGLGDATGQITYDQFNQPVSNALAGHIDPVTGFDACPISVRKDRLVGMVPTCPKWEAVPAGHAPVESPLAGQATIANLYPGLYEVVATPAADRIAAGEEWVQTNTLDGGKPHEAFIKPNEPGYFQEFGPGGFHVSIGFANPKLINDRKKGVCPTAAACPATLNVQITNNHMSRTPDQRTFSSETYDHYAFTQCYVSIGPADGEDFAFEKCDADGKVSFKSMPTGVFKLTVFDQWNDIMLDGLVSTVSIDGDTATKVFPVTQWRTNLATRTFIDTSGDGVSQDGEPGLALVNTNIRYRDGSIGFFNNTDLDGYAGFNEVFPFMNWLVVETSSTRFKPTGVHAVYDAGGIVDCSQQDATGPCSAIAAHVASTRERVPLPASLRVPGAKYCDTADCDPTTDTFAGGSTAAVFPPQAFGTSQGWQGLLGQNSFIEFGVKPFGAGENGGISGQVIYASTRPFDDPALSLQLQWEPGVPNATINLYRKTVDDSGNEHLELVDTTTSASWDDWAQGFRRDSTGQLMKDAKGNYIPNMNCPGQSGDSPFFATLKGSKQWLDTPDANGNKKTLANDSQFKCYDGWSQLNQVQPAPYDGYYRFPSVTATNEVTGKPAGTNCTICVDNPSGDGTKMLPAGKYVVEIKLPDGYELVKEEDKNILLGDVYIAPVTQQFAGFGNIFILPDQAAVAEYYNPSNPGNLNNTTNLGALPRHEGDTGSIESFWPCVGAERVVPDLNSLYPGAGQAAPFAGAKRRLCDRKEVTLQDEAAALAKFFVFSSTHVAGHFAGTITNDFASEFDPFSPQFGEKFGPPNLPVALRDFTGNEVARVYSDQWGIYNGLYFSSYSVNPPNPTGYVPQMSIACMNDPGPIKDNDPNSATYGQMITDPAYNPAYSNFCYETPFMPGFTAYMDTPVIPTQSFADGYNLPDTEFPDNTPAILSVVNSDSSMPQGPWVTVNTPATKPTASFTFGAVASGNSVSAVTVNAVNLMNGTATCNLLSLGCSLLSQQTARNTVMATLVATSINAKTGVTGYTAAASGATVTITAGTAGTSLNGTGVTVTKTGTITVSPSSIQLAGGAPPVPGKPGLTITALGDKVVQNPNFAGPNAIAAPYNQKTIKRHYGFGARPATCPTTGACPDVTVGGAAMVNVATWTDTTIVGDVPDTGVPACAVQQRGQPAALCGELVITAANGKQSIDAVTVTVGGSAPWIVTPQGVTPPAGKVVHDYGNEFGRLGASPIQVALDSAAPGDLVLVRPGTYRENLIMWKPVRLQGVGATSVTVNADAHPAGKMDQWRRQMVCVFGLDLEGIPNLGNAKFDGDGRYSCPAAMHLRADRIPFEAITGWDASGNGNLAQVLQEPTLMGAYEGAGITVTGRGVRIPANSNDFWGADPTAAGAYVDGSVYLAGGTDCATASETRVDGRDYGTSNYYCNPSRIDGLSVLNSSQGGGGVFVHGWGHNLEVANTRISGNHGTLAGGVNVGNGETPPVFLNDGTTCGAGTTALCPPIPAGTATNEAIPFAFNTRVRVHHNMIYNNASIGDALFTGTPAGAGGITVSSGGDNYQIDHNWIAGNLSTGDGGGIQTLGVSFNGRISNNYVLFNQSTNPTLPTNGGGIVIQGANEPRMLNGTECGAATDFDCPPGLGDGIGAGLVIDANLILGNSAESGSGGGLRLQQINGSELIQFPGNNARWYGVTVSNNIIANNVAGWDGAGVALEDALKVTLVNNTIVSNDTTASAGALFKTLGAVNASSPPPGCTNDPSQQSNLTCPLDGAPHAPQPAGLVTLAHTYNLREAIGNLPNITVLGIQTQVKILCPAPAGQNYGYTGTVVPLLGSINGDCMAVSKPRMVNDLFWHNRAFSVDVVDQNGNVVSGTQTPTGTGLLSQQNLIALSPLLNQTKTGECVKPATVPATFYYDVGLRTDDVASAVISFTANKLTAYNSIVSGDPQAVLTQNAAVVAAASPFVAEFCNGARVAPEKGDALKGYNAPPGASETTGLGQVFVFNGIKPTATVDEGHNWLNLTFGPLTLNRSAVNANAADAPELMVATARVGKVGGAYSVASTSPAVGGGLVNGLTPSTDFFGTPRSAGATTIGAVEVAGAPVAAVTPASVNFQSVVLGEPASQTLTLGNTGNVALNGIAVAVSPAVYTRQGGTCGTSLAAGASCTIIVRFAPTAVGTVAGTVTITATNGTVTGSPVQLSGTGVLPPPATLASIAPTSGAQGATVAVTLTGTNLATTSAVAVSGTGVACNVTGTPTATTATASCTIGAAAAIGARSVTVTTAAGPSSNAVTFTVTALPPAVALDCPSCVLNSTAFGAVSGTKDVTFTLTNSGGSFLVSNVSVVRTFGTTGTWAVVGGTCAVGGSVATNGTCTVVVRFTSPSTTNFTTATLTVTGTGAGGTYSASRNMNGS